MFLSEQQSYLPIALRPEAGELPRAAERHAEGQARQLHDAGQAIRYSSGLQGRHQLTRQIAGGCLRREGKRVLMAALFN